MIRNVFVVLFALLLCAASPESLIFDCKIEGRKGSDISTKLLVCSVRQRGELIGTILLRAADEANPLWDSVVAPAAVRAMQGDKVFLRFSSGVSPRITDPEKHSDLVNTTNLKVSDWRSLQVSNVREISETQYLGIATQPSRPPEEPFDLVAAKAIKLYSSPEGASYRDRVSEALSKPMSDALQECEKGVKPPSRVGLIFLIGADGTIDRILAAHDQPTSACLAKKLQGLKLPAPPKPGWLIYVNFISGWAS